MADAENPLLSPQREKIGSETKAKYSYQYHWALYRAIEEHSKENEYAIFVELHEDVVLCDSLDVNRAKFEFNQVKTTATTFTKNQLLKLKNGSSPLGKLVSSVAGKPFGSKISELNFVAISGFGITLKKPGIKLKKITLADIDDTDLNHLELAIKNELGVNPLPPNIQFIIPDLGESNFQNDVIAEISKLITKLFPGSNYNSVDIYRVLIDEINKKGEVKYDFAKWDELLKNKALTCHTVTEIINQYSVIKDQAKIEAGLTAALTDLKLNYLESIAIRKSFARYQQSRIGSKTLTQLGTTKSINEQLAHHSAASGNNIEVLLKSVYGGLDDKIKLNFANEDDCRAAILCELILGE